MSTSDAGLRGDLRSRTFGVLSFGVLLVGFTEGESESGPGILSFRAVRGVAGDFLWGNSEDEPALLSKPVEYH